MAVQFGTKETRKQIKQHTKKPKNQTSKAGSKQTTQKLHRKKHKKHKKKSAKQCVTQIRVNTLDGDYARRSSWQFNCRRYLSLQEKQGTREQHKQANKLTTPHRRNQHTNKKNKQTRKQNNYTNKMQTKTFVNEQMCNANVLVASTLIARANACADCSSVDGGSLERKHQLAA